MERRKAVRETVTLSLEYDLGATAGESGAGIHKAQAQNLCEYGLRILTDYPLRRGTVLRLNLVGNNPQQHLPIFAEVAWAMPEDDRFRAGLRFLIFK
jgi:hypothetical protein